MAKHCGSAKRRASKPWEDSRNPAKDFKCFPAGWWRCRRPNAGTWRGSLHDKIGQSLTVAELNLQAMLQSQGATPWRRA